MTDKNLVALPGMKLVLDSLQSNAINFEVYSNVHVEPTDQRFTHFFCLGFFVVFIPFLFIALSLLVGILACEECHTSILKTFCQTSTFGNAHLMHIHLL